MEREINDKVPNLKAGNMKIVLVKQVVGLVEIAQPDGTAGTLACLALADGGGDTVLVAVRQGDLGDLISTVMKLPETYRRPTKKARAGQRASASQISRHLHAERVQVLDPAKVDISPGHAVLRVIVAGVPLEFSAPAEVWQCALTALSTGGIAAPMRKN